MNWSLWASWQIMRMAWSTFFLKKMIILLSLILYLYFAHATDMKDKNKVTYGIDFKVECPLCKEMIPIGYAGPIGLAWHQGKKKCMTTLERNQREKNQEKERSRSSNRDEDWLREGTENLKKSRRRHGRPIESQPVAQIAPKSYLGAELKGVGCSRKPKDPSDSSSGSDGGSSSSSNSSSFIRKLGEVRFTNMTFTNLSQYYNTQITLYNHISAKCRIMVTS